MHYTDDDIYLRIKHGIKFDKETSSSIPSECRSCNGILNRYRRTGDSPHYNKLYLSSSKLWNEGSYKICNKCYRGRINNYDSEDY